MVVSLKRYRPWLQSFGRWLDNDAGGTVPPGGGSRCIDWPRTIPFIGMHVAVLGVTWVGVSTFAVVTAVILFALRLFAITAFYHRYFSHRAFRTSRLMQFVFAVLGATAVQRGALWWASQHRHHHAHADREQDSHSPHQHGFLWSHMGWFMARDNFHTRMKLLPDLARYPELRFLDRFDALVPILFAVAIYGLGEWLAHNHPDLKTSGPQLLVWGFVISTVVLYHVTFTINSLAHSFGSRRYATRDRSRNNFWLALLTFGEGWHNNHHFFPGSARQGFHWWEIDLTYYGLVLLAALGLVRELREVPEWAYHRGPATGEPGS